MFSVAPEFIRGDAAGGATIWLGGGVYYAREHRAIKAAVISPEAIKALR